MADPPLSPKSNAPFFVISLAGHNSNPIIPDAFFATHLEGENEFTKLKLTSDAFDRIWEVKLNGRRFASGWEDFSAAHSLRGDDILIFRHDGEMIFHVTPSGRNFSMIQCISSSSDSGRSFSKIQFISSSSDDSEDDDDDDDDSDDDDDDDDDDDEDDDEADDDDVDDETWDSVSDSKNITSKRKSRLKAESSSSENSCILGVTTSNLRLNRVSLARHFTRTNGLHKSWCEIDLMNQSGKSWVMGLRHNKITSQDFIRGRWRSFCRENNLKTGSFYRFKLVLNVTRPVLQLCSDITPQGNCSRENGKAKVSAKSNREGERSLMNQSKFITVTLKPYMLKSRQLRLRSSFARETGIKKGGEITLVDKNGGAWPSSVASAYVNGGYYMSKGLISFCEASGITTGETFTLEFVRGEGKTPMLKFYSKAKAKKILQDGPRGRGQASRHEDEEAQEETKTQLQKRARVLAEGETSRRTQASHESTADSKNLQCKQPLKTISAQVKQSIVKILADVRRFQSGLERKEQNLDALLQKIDA